MSLKDCLGPTKFKIIISILVMVIYYYIFLSAIPCPEILPPICEVNNSNSNTSDSDNYKPSTSILLSCNYVCSSDEYYIESSKSIILKIILPTIIIYLLLSLGHFTYNKIRTEK